MRTVLGALLAIGLGGVPAHAGSFEVDDWFEVIAQRLQPRLTRCAADGLLEADRGDGDWRYRFFADFDKAWMIEVRVRLAQRDAHTTAMRVEVVHVARGLLFDTTRVLPVETVEWTERVRSLSLPDASGAECRARSIARDSTRVDPSPGMDSRRTQPNAP